MGDVAPGGLARALLIFALLAFLAALLTSSAGCVDRRALPVGGQTWHLQGVGDVLVLQGCEGDVEWSASSVRYQVAAEVGRCVEYGARTYTASCGVFVENAVKGVQDGR